MVEPPLVSSSFPSSKKTPLGPHIPRQNSSPLTKKSTTTPHKVEKLSPIRASSNDSRKEVNLIINRAANRSQSRGETEMRMMVTQANEVLARDGIHGRIASVGVGFGTGRHTA